MTVYKSEKWLESESFPFYTALYSFYPFEVKEPHSHEFIELVFVANGTGIHTYGGVPFRISKGDVFVIEPGAEHSYEANDDALAVYNVLFRPALLSAEWETLTKLDSFIEFVYIEPFFRHFSEFDSHLVLNGPEHLELTFYLDQLLKEFTRKKAGYQVMVRTLLIGLLVHLSRNYSGKRETAQPKADASDEALLEEICRFIKQHYAQPLTLTQLSRLSGMSQTSFSAKFKRHTGETFVKYRNRVRVGIAADLLRNTVEKISVIALQTGFDDLSFFNKTFKELTGASPGQYREQSLDQQ